MSSIPSTSRPSWTVSPESIPTPSSSDSESSARTLRPSSPGLSTVFDPRHSSSTTFTSRLRPSTPVARISPAPNPHQEISSYTFLGDDGKLYEISYRVQAASGSTQKCLASRETWEAHAEQLKDHQRFYGGLLEPGCDRDIQLEKDPSTENFYLTAKSGEQQVVTEEFRQSYFAIPTYKGGLKEPVSPATAPAASAPTAATSPTSGPASGRVLGKFSSKESTKQTPESTSSSDSEDSEAVPTSPPPRRLDPPTPLLPTSFVTGTATRPHRPVLVSPPPTDLRPPLPAGIKVRNLKQLPTDDKKAEKPKNPDDGVLLDDGFVPEAPLPQSPSSDDET